MSSVIESCATAKTTKTTKMTVAKQGTPKKPVETKEKKEDKKEEKTIADKKTTSKSNAKHSAKKPSEAKELENKQTTMQKANVKTTPKVDKRKELGARGERLAAHYLENNGFTLLERNWQCKVGEADIIAKEDNSIVFIEIKTRSGIANGFPEDAVTPERRRRYEKIALLYLDSHDVASARVRFDVIAINVIDEKKCMLRHHRDAFSVDEW